ncbi:MAG: T9SS type A sorting domain-containing protein [Chlorobi bacterium]|nr:T9SS type A sorting domain-containing protein [Chlorobiota bacterium]
MFAQNEVLISDDANLIISENTYFKVPGNVELGNGTSGKITMKGNTFEVTGDLNINAGSNFDISNGTFSATNTNFAETSTVTYDGTNQEIKNYNYGALILNGTGNMQVTGTLASPTTCKSLTINNTGNNMYVAEGKAITIEGELVNNAGVEGIKIASSPNGDGSVISYTTDVDATVGRYISGNRWYYLSSPIDAAPISLFNTNNFLWWDASMEWGGLGDYDPWKSFQEANLYNVQGYAYYYYEDTIMYKGKMNVSDYSYTLRKNSGGLEDNQGWNLIGNPYTSVLDWDAAVADGAVPTGVENAIYFFDDDGTGAQSNYRYYVPSTGGTYGVGTNDGTGKIPLGQAFFIKTNTDNAVLNFSKDYRVHNAQSFYKSDDQEFIKLRIYNDYYDETIIRLVDNSSYAFDAEYDARKLFPNNLVPQIYCIGEGGKQIAINSIPEIQTNTIIPIGVDAVEGEYKISLDQSAFDNYDIYLVDNYENVATNLNYVSSYSFSHEGSKIDNRFYLAFKELASEVNEIDLGISLYPNPASDYVKIINTNGAEFNFVKIYSVNGTIKYYNGNAKGPNEIDLSNFSEGIYFIQIGLNDGNIFHQKILIQK